MADDVVTVNYVRFLIQICRGLIYSHRVRRTIMFYDMLVVLALMFLGTTFLWSWLREHPFFFLCYWGVCGWLTILAALMAIYDMAKVRIEARHEEARLRQEYLAGKDSDSSHDSHPT